MVGGGGGGLVGVVPTGKKKKISRQLYCRLPQLPKAQLSVSFADERF